MPTRVPRLAPDPDLPVSPARPPPVAPIPPRGVPEVKSAVETLSPTRVKLTVEVPFALRDVPLP